MTLHPQIIQLAWVASPNK